MADIFKRLSAGRPPQAREVIKQQQQRGSPTSAKTFLMDILAKGPLPATLVEEQGAARGFSKHQLRYARRQTSVVTFKKRGTTGGGWFWTLPRHDPRPAVVKKPNDHFTRRLRNLSKILGYRLQPTGKATE